MLNVLYVCILYIGLTNFLLQIYEQQCVSELTAHDYNSD